MVAFIAKRLLSAPATLLAVLTVLFVIIRIVPGAPAIAILGDNATAQAVAGLRERLGLDHPLYAQYRDFLLMILRGDLGSSMVTGQPVWDEVRSALPYTLELTIASIAVGIVLGLPIGTIAAINRNRTLDYAARIGSLLGVRILAFYIEIILIMEFTLHHGRFPVIRRGHLMTHGYRGVAVR